MCEKSIAWNTHTEKFHSPSVFAPTLTFVVAGYRIFRGYKELCNAADRLPKDSCLWALSEIRHAKWFDARAACLDLGADLALPESEEQTQVLLDLWEQDSPYMPIGAVRGQNFVKEDGNPLLWQNWLVGEPNNGNGDENCVAIFKWGKWNDFGCIYSYTYPRAFQPACQKGF